MKPAYAVPQATWVPHRLARASPRSSAEQCRRL